MKIVIISDTHNLHTRMAVPPGDVLIHCGDATMRGTRYEIIDFIKWFGSLLHKHKIYVSGNHDFVCQQEPNFVKALCATHGVYYLQDSSVHIEGRKFYGSPWQPWYHDWAWNFQDKNTEQAKKCWEKIPDDTDILITHGPAYQIGDLVNRPRPGEDPHVGCVELRKRINSLNLKLHCWGHIHEGFGMYRYPGLPTVGINASSLDGRYKFTNNPVVIFLDSDESAVPASSQRSENNVASTPTNF